MKRYSTLVLTCIFLLVSLQACESTITGDSRKSLEEQNLNDSNRLAGGEGVELPLYPNIHEIFLAIEQISPGFGGFYLDDEEQLVVIYTDSIFLDGLTESQQTTRHFLVERGEEPAIIGQNWLQ